MTDWSLKRLFGPVCVGRRASAPFERVAQAPDDAPTAHPLRSRHVAMITVGSIIGAGLFVGSSASIAAVGPAVLVSYAAAGLLILVIMHIVTQMATPNARAGAFTELVRQGLGEWAGFVTGWLYWYFWVVVVPIESLAAANIIHLVIPIPVWQIGIALIGATTAINLVSARSYGEIEFWLSLIKVAGVVLFVVIAATYLARLASPIHQTWSNLDTHRGFAPFGTVAIVAGVASAVFALTGAELTTIAAAESTDPVRAVRQITRSLALRILLFYLVPIALVLAVIPWDSVKPGVSPFATALSAMHIPGAVAIMNVVVLAAVLSYLNSALYATSRILFVLASKGDAPRCLTRVNRRGYAPARAIIASSLFGYLALCVSILSPEVVFSFLINTSGTTMLFIYALVCLAHARGRHRSREARVYPWSYPVSTYAAILGIGAVLAAMAMTTQLASQLYSSVLVAALACGAYALRRTKLPRVPCDAKLTEACAQPVTLQTRIPT